MSNTPLSHHFTRYCSIQQRNSETLLDYLYQRPQDRSRLVGPEHLRILRSNIQQLQRSLTGLADALLPGLHRLWAHVQELRKHGLRAIQLLPQFQNFRFAHWLGWRRQHRTCRPKILALTTHLFKNLAERFL